MPRIQLNQDTIDLVEKIIVHLIQLHVSNEVDDFLEHVSGAFGAATTRTPSSVEIEEIFEDENQPAPPPQPQQHRSTPSSSHRQQREAAPCATRENDDDIQFTTQDGRPYVDPNPRSEQEETPRLSTVAQAWADLESQLEEVLSLSNRAAKEERQVFASFSLFWEKYGSDAAILAGEWPDMIRKRCEELDELRKFRERRHAAEERERRAEEIRERNRQRARREQEAAQRKLQEQLDAARRDKEAAEAKAKQIEEERRLAEERLRENANHAEQLVREAKRNMEKVEDEIRKQRNKQAYREANPRKIECFVCGYPGVKRSKECPNFENHKNVRSCGPKNNK